MKALQLESSSFFSHYQNLLSERKNKVDIISPGAILQLQSVVVHNPKPEFIQSKNDKKQKHESNFPSVEDQDLPSEKFEVLLLNFLKISYYLGITPYYMNTVILKNGTKNLETIPSGKLHTVTLFA